AVITAHALTGLTTRLVLHYFLLAAPVVIGGVYLGSLLYDRIDTSAYLKLLQYLLLAMGILMIWKGV
ncbi:sulfite exporter TauE/SafE family protein, partial [Thermodesulfobacteriota bacterium]